MEREAWGGSIPVSPTVVQLKLSALKKVVQLLGLLTPIFPVIWGAKCYLQAS